MPVLAPHPRLSCNPRPVTLLRMPVPWPPRGPRACLSCTTVLTPRGRMPVLEPPATPSAIPAPHSQEPGVDYLLAGLVGIGLAAACGLRAFVPVLGLALAAKAGWVSLGPSFAWLATWPAIAALAAATLLETSASLLPVVSHALDALAAPVACGAGALVLASQFGASRLGSAAGLPDVSAIDPMLQWAAVLIAGGGVATAVHATSAAVRAGSAGASAGLLAPVYGALETGASIVASILAFVVPFLFAVATVVAVGLGVTVAYWLLRRRSRRRSALEAGFAAVAA